MIEHTLYYPSIIFFFDQLQRPLTLNQGYLHLSRCDAPEGKKYQIQRKNTNFCQTQDAITE